MTVRKLATATVMMALGACHSAMAATTATATTTNSVLAAPGSFTALLDTVVIGGLSNVSGSVFFGTGALELSTLFGPVILSIQDPDSPLSLSLGSAGTTTATPAGYRFVFNNVGAGTYTLSASGTNAFGATLLGATYSVSSVPEPEAFALLLAGLGALGFMARRRGKNH